MRIVIGYPPLKGKGTPLLSQNRQFQWFSSPTYIYPVVPAYAATMLKNAGHQVFWLDGIARSWSLDKWLSEVKKVKPDLVFMETKTPVIHHHWKIIDKLKIVNCKLKIILSGDHVTALPKESFKNSQVDYILTGGDYDWLLLNLVEHLNKDKKLEPGIWYRSGRGGTKNTGKFKLNHDLNKLPEIDRELTRCLDYAYKNGNFKNTPGAYIMAGRDCWWRQSGGCSFCSWTTLYPQWRVRSVDSVLDEIEHLVDKYQVKEIMDDTGSFPMGDWLRQFCQGMIKRGLNKKINFNCNLRFGSLGKQDYSLMVQAGFRLLLFGLESGHQPTLDRIGKGIEIKKIKPELKLIQQVNKKYPDQLQPHLTFMFGYPWEKKTQAEKTINLAKNLFSSGLIDSLQATLIIPYPGTRLFKEAEKQNWLKTKDWSRYDMSQPILTSPINTEKLKKMPARLYRSFANPGFVLKTIKNIRSWQDIKYLFKAGLKVLAHTWDFK